MKCYCILDIIRIKCRNRTGIVADFLVGGLVWKMVSGHNENYVHTECAEVHEQLDTVSKRGEYCISPVFLI